MTNVSDVLEPRERRQSSPLRSSFLLVPFSDASYTESRASSPVLKVQNTLVHSPTHSSYSGSRALQKQPRIQPRRPPLGLDKGPSRM
ncbi:hypothetical protein L227DRAFT_578931 [Lentinus tigrinus ALCF2SS1-6]|uniref:Uncharacterized protein n=1 Tax=Lentinus tigrinus ALCF2SS1-6 TaxID=1328759 RepID=A0A5C2RYQ0_9APHY|nr:hypothetical protein L227DRAFT_578931 [Lentinus tigrinus ALCF2SS1-6]